MHNNIITVNNNLNSKLQISFIYIRLNTLHISIIYSRPYTLGISAFIYKSLLFRNTDSFLQAIFILIIFLFLLKVVGARPDISFFGV